jgi:DNA-binding response OmpR family regulator
MALWSGKRALVVEDESMIAMLLEDCLQEMGCQVIATASRLEQAVALAGSAAIDFAILDLNLNGKLSYPVADALIARGMPFIFSTGYGAGALPPRFQRVPTVGKPFQPQELEAAVGRALRPAA